MDIKYWFAIGGAIFSASIAIFGWIGVGIKAFINSRVLDALQNNHLKHIGATLDELKVGVKDLADIQTACKNNSATLFRELAERVAKLEGKDNK